MPSPTRPAQLSRYAEVVLQALAGAGLGHKISLGGALGLQHYCRECWRLWRERQQRAGSDLDPYRARLAIETHLSRIAQHRPLDTIAEPEQRTAAASLRDWFAQEFLDALVD
jgi:hypothetical protein